jgi:hypothetical protein
MIEISGPTAQCVLGVTFIEALGGNATPDAIAISFEVSKQLTVLPS